jgi:hypothetical protein
MRPCTIAFVAGLLGAATVVAAGPAAAQAQRQFSLTLYDQPDYRGASVTFFDDNANVGSTGFADRAQSAQVRGTWRVCDGGGYRNRCEVLSANVRDLAAFGFAGRVGSVQLLDAPRGSTYADMPPVYTPPSAYPPPASAYPAPYPGGDERGRDRDAYPREDYGPGPYDRDDRDDREAPYPPAANAPSPPSPAAGRGVEGWTAVFFAQPSLNGADVSARSPRAADAFCRAQRLGTAIYFDQSRRSARAVDPDGRSVGEGPVLSDVLCRK